MKVLLDIKDKKAALVMSLLNDLPYVKAKEITSSKALFLKEMKEAVDNLNLVKQGKLKARPAKDLLKGL